MTAAQAFLDELPTLIAPRTTGDRERLLMAVADLCDRANLAGEPLSSRAEINSLLQDIFLNLIATAERDLRRRLAERLGRASWAPHGLVTILALDEIEIARPVIAASPVLTENDLLKVLIEATLEHQIEVARRPDLPARVVDAIIEESQPLVMAALADNQTAQMGIAQLTRMVAASRRLAALRSSLVRHPKLTVDLAYALYAWVGETLRAAIVARFRIDEDKLNEIIAAIVRDQRAGDEQSPRIAPDQPSQSELDLEQQLITKLDAAGQLRPGYLLRALREGKLSLFKASLARLGGFPREAVDLAIESGRADLLALACAAVGIDRSVFPTLHRLITDLMGRRIISSPATQGDVIAAFAETPETAARIFHDRVARLMRPAG